MERYEVTMKEITRYKVIKKWEEGKVRGKEVSVLLGISYRQALRLRRRFRHEGMKGLIDRRSGHRGIRDEVKREVVRLFKEVYGSRFNILHFKEKLEEEHGISISYEKVRQILIEAGIHRVKRRRRGYRKRRRRRPGRGMLIQMDTSEHEWIEGLGRKHLICMIDDATGEIVYGRFEDTDSTFTNMAGIKEVIKRKGVFYALYVDRASHFTTTRKGGIHYDVREEQGMTNIEKALDELGITLIKANSPQAKGRIERAFRTLQDRLINEMWIKGIKDYKEANRYLQRTFIPFYNKKYAKKVKECFYRPLPEDIDLNLVFTKRTVRRVNKDNTVSFMGEKIQLMPTGKKLNFVRAEVEIRWSHKEYIWILYNGNVILKTKLSKKNKKALKEKKIEKLLSQRRYV